MYALKREGLSGRVAVYREGNQRLRSDDYDQDLLDYLVDQMRNGKLKRGIAVSFNSTQTAFIHSFPESFIGLSGWFYQEIIDGNVELRCYDGTVKAYSKETGEELRIGE